MISRIKKYFIESDRLELFSIKESSYGYNRLVIYCDITPQYLELITRNVIFSERFKQIHLVTNQEIDLIHRCYFDVYGNYDIWLNIKRPFGNSDIEGDISHIYKRKCDEQECSDIMDRIIYLIQEFLTDPLEPYDKMDLDDIETQKKIYLGNNMSNYKNYMEGFDRKEKIKKILDM